MITPDANIVLYAYNEDAPQHANAKQWLEENFSSPVPFGLSWQVITAFLRISILAALAIEHGATLATTDRDFSKFSNLKTINPL